MTGRYWNPIERQASLVLLSLLACINDNLWLLITLCLEKFNVASRCAVVASTVSCPYFSGWLHGSILSLKKARPGTLEIYSPKREGVKWGLSLIGPLQLRHHVTYFS